MRVTEPLDRIVVVRLPTKALDALEQFCRSRNLGRADVLRRWVRKLRRRQEEAAAKKSPAEPEGSNTSTKDGGNSCGR